MTIQALKHAGGVGRFFQDTQIALGHMWGSAKALGWGTMRGDPFGAVSRYVGGTVGAAEMAATRSGGLAQTRLSRLASQRRLGRVGTLRGQAAVSGLTAQSVTEARNLRQYGSYGMYGLAGIGAMRAVGGEGFFGGIGTAAGFGVGYSRSTVGRRKNRFFRGGIRGVGFGVVGAAVGREVGSWI